MATQTTPLVDDSFFGDSAVNAKARLYCTYVVSGIGEPKKTKNPLTGEEGKGLYWMADLELTPTRGSRKVFANMLFRVEQFKGGFKPEVYKDYAANPQLGETLPGKKMTIGESFAFVYSTNIKPHVERNKDGSVKLRKDGTPLVKGCTNLMAVGGGTLAGLGAIAGYVKLENSKPDASEEEQAAAIARGIRKYIAERDVNGAEVLATLKQQVQDGELRDNYELDRWIGPFNAENHEVALSRAEKSAGKSAGEREVVAYTV